MPCVWVLADRPIAIFGWRIDLLLDSSQKSESDSDAALKSAATAEADRYTLKGPRRGFAAEIKRSGPTLTPILGIGVRNGPCFEFRPLALRDDEEKLIRDLALSVDGKSILLNLKRITIYPSLR